MFYVLNAYVKLITMCKTKEIHKTIIKENHRNGTS